MQQIPFRTITKRILNQSNDRQDQVMTLADIFAKEKALKNQGFFGISLFLGLHGGKTKQTHKPLILLRF